MTFEADPRGESASSSAAAMATAAASITDLPHPTATATASVSTAGATAQAKARKLPSGTIRVQASASTPETSTADKPASTLCNPTSQPGAAADTVEQAVDLGPGLQPPERPSTHQAQPSSQTQPTGPHQPVGVANPSPTTRPAPTPSAVLKVHDHDFEEWPKKMQLLWKPLSDKLLGTAYDHVLGLFVAFERSSGFKYWSVSPSPPPLRRPKITSLCRLLAPSSS